MEAIKKLTETIIIKEGSKNGNSGYIEVYRAGETKRFESIVRCVATINRYFREIEQVGVKKIINETMYSFPQNMPYSFEIIDNKQ